MRYLEQRAFAVYWTMQRRTKIYLFISQIDRLKLIYYRDCYVEWLCYENAEADSEESSLLNEFIKKTNVRYWIYDFFGFCILHFLQDPIRENLRKLATIG